MQWSVSNIFFLNGYKFFYQRKLFRILGNMCSIIFRFFLWNTPGTSGIATLGLLIYWLTGLTSGLPFPAIRCFHFAARFVRDAIQTSHSLVLMRYATWTNYEIKWISQFYFLQYPMSLLEPMLNLHGLKWKPVIHYKNTRGSDGTLFYTHATSLVDLLFVQFILVQPVFIQLVFVQSISSNPFRPILT